MVRFNEHWTSGLKTLFNLNLVGLDSNEEIVDIFMSVKGLSKEHIAEYFSCEKGFELFDIFLRKAASKHKQHLFLTLLHLHRFIPLSKHPSIQKPTPSASKNLFSTTTSPISCR